ncbi:MAG: hypothetical protein ONB44_12490 [candidate division KSB1 bacterium]|nr:hypothetical protein [candidate division KSB1 bacterium]MDZ7302940.1 hypothetical protein [candidate division KSB1 bacterium]MDZ7312216.1 hypothetical protein [candidate division KSB1 bacterium]
MHYLHFTASKEMFDDFNSFFLVIARQGVAHFKENDGSDERGLAFKPITQLGSLIVILNTLVNLCDKKQGVNCGRKVLGEEKNGTSPIALIKSENYPTATAIGIR